MRGGPGLGVGVASTPLLAHVIPYKERGLGLGVDAPSHQESVAIREQGDGDGNVARPLMGFWSMRWEVGTTMLDVYVGFALVGCSVRLGTKTKDNIED